MKTKYIKSFLLFLLLGCCISVSAQNIQGVVTDSLTNEPIPYLSVFSRFVVRSEETVLDSELLHSLRIEEMLKQVLGMLEMTKNALNEENLELALNVFSKDNLLDEINAAAPAVLTKYLETHPDNFLTCLELGTVIRKLERAGDHITNIAEEIVFFIDAKVLKHRDKVDGHFLGKEKTH